MSDTIDTISEDLSDPVIIHTDGACSGNPGPGGWAAVLERPEQPEGSSRRLKEISGGTPYTTNNRMELTAAIEALACLKGTSRNVRIVTDSKLLMKGATKWLPDWKARGWKTATKNPVVNIDLWERLDELQVKHRVAWEWTKGHDGNPGNERADALAQRQVAHFKKWKNQPWRNA